LKCFGAGLYTLSVPRRKSGKIEDYRHKKIEDYRHKEATRKNNPPAGLAPGFERPAREKKTYAFDPHLDPQLVWAGKAGLKAYEFDEGETSFSVDTVSLHIHERVSTKAILQAVKRPSPIGDMFADLALPLDKQLEFYQHEMDWVNRLILGDSLLVMNSLLVKEGMAGKVQMIYIDPPYGIKYASNFQPRIDRRDVKDKDEDLTHEPEQIKAYRDTWELGIHSYLTYLRDRLLLCRELLHESGSIFVQINDENLHLVRCLLDEVFGRENFVAVISFRKTGSQTAHFLASTFDFLLWYSKKIAETKFRKLYIKDGGWAARSATQWIELPTAERRPIASDTDKEFGQVFTHRALQSTTPTEGSRFPISFMGSVFRPIRGWSTSELGIKRLLESERLIQIKNSLRFVVYLDDFPYSFMTSNWYDTGGPGELLYSVQTATKVIERCILMTTDPGDLVLDPTCGSGTTAYCAEKWGRRWITIDTSRVALAIARQRILTAKFDYYKLREPERGPAGGFIYKTVPHITLESIAHNEEIDEIAARYQPEIDQSLAELNKSLRKAWKEWEVPREIPHPVWTDEAKSAYWQLQKLLSARKPDQQEVERLLELIYQRTGHRWTLKEIPEPVPSDDWPEKAKKALRRFWELKRKKRKEIDESIWRRAPQESLYDQPEIEKGIVRVSGPFTVEAILPPVLDPTQVKLPERAESEAVAGDFVDNILGNLQKTGLVFSGGKRLALENLKKVNIGFLHLEAEAKRNGDRIRVAVSIGPREGPVTGNQAVDAIRSAVINGYNMLVLAGFAFEPTVSALAAKAEKIEVHLSQINPDLLMSDLLKTTRASQLFSVFGLPDIQIAKAEDGKLKVELMGVDIYDPNTGETIHESGKKVAAWFLDTDYDGMVFHICQAFFPGGEDPWDKLKGKLKAEIDESAFERMRGTVSFPFEPGEHKQIAVKVIDFRGNEVMRVEKV